MVFRATINGRAQTDPRQRPPISSTALNAPNRPKCKEQERRPSVNRYNHHLVDWGELRRSAHRLPPLASPGRLSAPSSVPLRFRYLGSPVFLYGAGFLKVSHPTANIKRGFTEVL